MMLDVRGLNPATCVNTICKVMISERAFEQQATLLRSLSGKVEKAK